MRTFIGFLLFACLASAALAHLGGRVVLERADGKDVPHGWSRVEGRVHDRLVPSTTTLTFALKQRNIGQLKATLDAVSYPGSEHYRDFLSFEDVVDMVAPTNDDIERVVTWLTDAGIDVSAMELSASRDFLSVRGVSVKKASSLLQCPFELFKSVDGEHLVSACVQPYSVPASVAPLLDFIGGVAFFPKLKRRLPTPMLRETYNSPIISKASPGEDNFNLFFLPRCDDGFPVSSDHLACASGPISEFDISVTQYGFTQRKYIEPPQLHCSDVWQTCMACSSWTPALQSDCMSTNSELGLSADTVYCLSPTVSFGLRPYVVFDIELTAHYANGTASEVYVYPKPIVQAKFVSPQTLLEYYGATEEDAITTTPFNTQSVAEFLGEFYSPADLVQFYAMNGIAEPIRVELVGPNNATQPGTEASLDIQFMMGLARNSTTFFWSLGALHNGQEPFLEWILQVLNSGSAPLVHSVSYADDENTLTTEYMERVNNEFMKSGALGITLLFASGDNGVNSAMPGAANCTVAGQFTPSFPSTSQYVTAVGGTQFSTQTAPVCSMNTQYGLPITCDTVGEITSSIETGSRITSGGGFSDVFPMPDFQQEAVAGYLQLVGDSIPSSYFNNTGRAYPDIAACARNFLVVVAGSIHPTDGTSAATPTAAALMTMVNNKLLVSQGTKLGWINPTLYAAPSSVYHDITMGNNACGEDISSCCPYGFPATPGYDCVTGLGTINYQAFLSYMTSL